MEGKAAMNDNAAICYIVTLIVITIILFNGEPDIVDAIIKLLTH